MSDWTYPELGATGDPAHLPPGYRHLHVRHRLGVGPLGPVGEALLTWQVHAAAGFPITADAPRAAPGVAAEARIGLGALRLPAPCRVVRVEETADRVGFAYGTLPGHVFVGEEAFAVERDRAGVLWLVVTAFSRPAWGVLRPAGPVVGVLQRLFLRRLAVGARRCRLRGTEEAR